nr:hypothetical protein [Tanacetum cinerariifolium]
MGKSGDPILPIVVKEYQEKDKIETKPDKNGKRGEAGKCGKDAHIGYNCPSKVPVISIPEPCNNQTIDELPQAMPNFHPTFHSEAESPFTLDSTPTYVDESPNIFNPPPQPPVDEHLDTIPAMESDTFIKSCAENLVPNPKIRFAKRSLYDNSSPRPPEEIVSDISNADIESFSPSPIPNKDSDSHMEEIDLYFNLDDPMPPGIEEEDNDDSERDIPILKELLDNYSLSLPTNESYHFDIPSPYRPPAKPPDGNTGTLNIKMMGDVSDQK